MSKKRRTFEADEELDLITFIPSRNHVNPQGKVIEAYWLYQAMPYQWDKAFARGVPFRAVHKKNYKGDRKGWRRETDTFWPLYQQDGVVSYFFPEKEEK